MQDLISLLIYVFSFLFVNIFFYKHSKILCKSSFVTTTFFSAMILPIHGALALDKSSHLIIPIVTLLLFQVISICCFASKLFNYKKLTLITFICSCYFLIICSGYFGEYYLKNNLVFFSDDINANVSKIINNANYSLRLKMLHLQKYYISAGFKYYFELPEYSYIDYTFIVQYILGKLFDITIFASLGNFLINKYNHLISHD